MKNYKKRNKGVPMGYPEAWKYVGRWKERKIAPRTWKFRFQATKRRKAKTYGELGKGTTGRWYIQGIQDIIKTGKGQYQTDFKGTKKSMGFRIKKPRRRKY